MIVELCVPPFTREGLISTFGFPVPVPLSGSSTHFARTAPRAKPFASGSPTRWDTEAGILLNEHIAGDGLTVFRPCLPAWRLLAYVTGGRANQRLPLAWRGCLLLCASFLGELTSFTACKLFSRSERPRRLAIHKHSLPRRTGKVCRRRLNNPRWGLHRSQHVFGSGQHCK
jgi:hypothetical protein